MANMLNARCECPEFHGTGFCPIPTTEHRVPRWVTLPHRAQVELKQARPMARLTELREA